VVTLAVTVDLRQRFGFLRNTTATLASVSPCAGQVALPISATSILYEVAPQVKGEAKSPFEAYSEIDPVTRRHQSKGACE
jgi:hypothetical protein